MSNPVTGFANWVRRRCCRLILIILALFWLATMPVHPYRPYCRNPDPGPRYVYFGPRISAEYRAMVKQLLSGGLSDTGFGVPSFEIGDYLIVPINEWTDFDTPLEDDLWIYRAFFGWDGNLWSNVNGKATINVARIYAQKHPDSDIAKLREAFRETIKIGKKFSTEEARRRRCALVKAVVELGLDS